MPCYDSRNDPGPIRDRLNIATRVACELAKALVTAQNLAFWEAPLSRETKEWIKEHDKLDEERRAKAKKRKSRNRFISI